MSVHVFGVRHHGPGSARSVLKALNVLKPDAVLIEGPPEAGEIIPLLEKDDMEPPVAILCYVADNPRYAAHWPFAHFSPEWQALQYAKTKKIPARFIDIPATHTLAWDIEETQRLEELAKKAAELAAQQQASGAVPNHAAGKTDTDDGDENDADNDVAENENDVESSKRGDWKTEIASDPLTFLARIDGLEDGERWWERLVEERRGEGYSTEIFDAVLEAMKALRQEMPAPPALSDATNPHKLREARREAHMRRCIRSAQKEYKDIAVICGAWHAPVLSEMPNAVSADDDLLKGLPKAKIATTWVPWSYGRLASDSGYGAGVRSPGWYDHLWGCKGPIAATWIARIARLMRGKGMDVSPAHIIDCVRTAETLAALRDRPIASLPELNDAVRSVLCFGDDLPLRMIERELIIGERLGAVPPETPMLPIQLDFQRQQKSLRLKPDASGEELILDLRLPLDLERSSLFRRLDLIGIPWGKGGERASGKGTFKESWVLKWEPEFTVRLIAASVYGNNIREAAVTMVKKTGESARELRALTALARQAIYADLPEAVEPVVLRLQTEAATASDITHLMEALPDLAHLLRYGDVRKSDLSRVSVVFNGLATRVFIGLPNACSGLNEEAAETMLKHLQESHQALTLLENEALLTDWYATLGCLSGLAGAHGVLQGRCCRLLLDAGQLDDTEAKRRFGFALSTAAEPAQAAAWVEGFLSGSGQILIADEKLWNLIDAWVSSLSAESFIQLLPVLSRTFSNFSAPERRQMGERVKRGVEMNVLTAATQRADFDVARADAALPMLSLLLGLK